MNTREILGFNSDEYSSRGLMCCDAVWRRVPVFRKTLLISSGQRSKVLQNVVTRCLNPEEFLMSHQIIR